MICHCNLRYEKSIETFLVKWCFFLNFLENFGFLRIYFDLEFVWLLFGMLFIFICLTLLFVFYFLFYSEDLTHLPIYSL